MRAADSGNVGSAMKRLNGFSELEKRAGSLAESAASENTATQQEIGQKAIK